MEANSESNAGRPHGSIPPYSEQEAKVLEERLLNQETSSAARLVLITWLERGECNEDNAAHFLYFFQLCSNYIKKLLVEQRKQKGESSLNKTSILFELDGIKKLFELIETRNITDNFTQIQMEEMRELRKTVSQEFQIIVDSVIDELNASNKKGEELRLENERLKETVSQLESGFEESREESNSINVGDNQNPLVAAASQCDQKLTKEMIYISYFSVFLSNHPGVDIDYIYSKAVDEIDVDNAAEIEMFLRRYPKIFKESSPKEAMEKTTWTCISFTPEELAELRNKQ